MGDVAAHAILPPSACSDMPNRARYGPVRGAGAGFGAVSGVVVGAPAAPGRLAGAGTGATPTGVPDPTVTCTLLVTPLSVTVIVTVPGPLNVTLPVLSTVAMFGSLELHVDCPVTSCVLPSAKVAVAVACPLWPTLPVVVMMTPVSASCVTAPCVFDRLNEAGTPVGLLVRSAVTL